MPRICDEYAARDGRITVIHQKNSGYGRAVNRGFSSARGEYMGIIESDDWIEPDMFQELYDAVVKYNADMVKCPFWIHDSTAFLSRKRDELYILKNRDKALLDLTRDAPSGAFRIEDCPLLASAHSSLWAALYRSDFVRKTPFMESPSASYQDAPFTFEALCRADRITIVPRPLLHWRVEGAAQGNSTSLRDRRALAMMDRFSESKEIIKKYGKYDLLKEAFYLHAINACGGVYDRIEKKYKKEAFFRLRDVFLELQNDRMFKFAYFDTAQKRLVRCLLGGRYHRSLVYSGKMLRRFLASMRFGRAGFMMQLLGLRFSYGECENRPALLDVHLRKLSFKKTQVPRHLSGNPTPRA
jgi:glycosyltransferase involved in cell wall biosynthesis